MCHHRPVSGTDDLSQRTERILLQPDQHSQQVQPLQQTEQTQQTQQTLCSIHFILPALSTRRPDILPAIVLLLLPAQTQQQLCHQ